MARQDIDDDVLEKIANAFLNDADTLMAAVLTGEDNQKYDGGFFLTEVDDADYDYVRDMYKTIGVDTSSFVGE